MANTDAAAQADLALRYGRELLAVEQTSRPRLVEDFTYAGQAGAGSTDSPDALRPTSDFFAGNRPDGPDNAHRWRNWVDEFARRPAYLWSPFEDALQTGQEPLVVSEFGSWGLPDPDRVAGPTGRQP